MIVGLLNISSVIQQCTRKEARKIKMEKEEETRVEQIDKYRYATEIAFYRDNFLFTFHLQTLNLLKFTHFSVFNHRMYTLIIFFV